ncbi:uncharacterized protein Dmoj_GI22230 [Drosophila mojavensis]|uniref:Ionotropic glutamate receptor C-terminal domain-containing protein n=2 Tax=Drosophila mojavensis TaxID=7230 RepID=B4K7T1_DROMO|nr:uncharacterized protein Dmoj_GI22230 [Drosophila mojavensis]
MHPVSIYRGPHGCRARRKCLKMLLTQQLAHLTKLIQIIVSQYFAPLSSLLIVHNSTHATELQEAYLTALQLSLRNLSQPRLLQWIDVAQLPHDESQPDALEWQVLRAVNASVTEGFITLLPDTRHFLHARYFATRNANVRLKDKLYLFLCELEEPRDLLSMEILQFYPHHLMVRPAEQANKGCGEADVGGFVSGARARARAGAGAGAGAGEAAVSLPHPYRDINLELWTQKFVGGSGNLDAIFLDAFLPNETFANRAELYPNKLLNLQRRALRLGSITYVPYTVTNYVAAGVGNEDPINPHRANRTIAYDGSEANIMRSFCEVHNCHLRIEAYGADNWGSIYDNESADGMLGDLYKQRVELAIGCIYNWYDGITETSHAIARSAVTILGPASVPLQPWCTDILPFNGGTWFLLISTIGVCSLVLYVLRYSNYIMKRRKGKASFVHGENVEKSLLDIFALFIQQPSAPLTFDRFATRFFLATLLCATITLENIYSGQLKSLLTVPLYADPVDSIEKWAQAQWKWAAPSIIWVHTVEQSDLLTDQILADNFQVRDYTFMYNASFKPNYGLGIERLASGAFNFGNYVTREAVENRIVMHDDLYFDWTRAVSIRGWSLMPLLNRHIRACQESGLYVHWELENVDKYLDKKTGQVLFNQAIGYVPKKAPKALEVDDISAALFVLAFGHAIAGCALMLELLHQRLLHRRN